MNGIDDCDDNDNASDSSVVQITLDESDDDVTGVESSNKSISLEIDVDYDRMVAQLYEQISAQNIAMNKACLIANEETNMHISVAVGPNKSGSINICKIPGDGNCLFSSLAQQIFHSKINSSEHIDQTRKLREDVVNTIKENYDLFLFDLKGRVFDMIDNDEFDINPESLNIENECKRFVENLLPKENHFGGSETIKAVSMFYKTNIIVFLENSRCIFGTAFDGSYTKIACIPYRKCRNHYDSVRNMQANLIYNVAEQLLNIDEKRIGPQLN